MFGLSLCSRLISHTDLAQYDQNALPNGVFLSVSAFVVCAKVNTVTSSPKLLTAL